MWENQCVNMDINMLQEPQNPKNYKMYLPFYVQPFGVGQGGGAYNTVVIKVH